MPALCEDGFRRHAPLEDARQEGCAQEEGHGRQEDGGQEARGQEARSGQARRGEARGQEVARQEDQEVARQEGQEVKSSDLALAVPSRTQLVAYLRQNHLGSPLVRCGGGSIPPGPSSSFRALQPLWLIWTGRKSPLRAPC